MLLFTHVPDTRGVEVRKVRGLAFASVAVIALAFPAMAQQDSSAEEETPAANTPAARVLPMTCENPNEQLNMGECDIPPKTARCYRCCKNDEALIVTCFASGIACECGTFQPP
jgi:hypothetical protein